MESHYNIGSMFAFYASFTTFLTLAKQFIHQFVPEQIRDYIDEKIKEWFSKRGTSLFTLVIKQQFDECGYSCDNSVYNACDAYLAEKLRSLSTRLEGCRKDQNNHDEDDDDDDDHVSYRVTQEEQYVEYVPLDENNKNVKLQWNFLCKYDKEERSFEKSFELSFDPKYKDLVLDTFIPSVVMKRYDEMKKRISLYTYGSGGSSRDWNAVSFKHPFTFDALALDPELKKSIINDLNMFIKRKEFYKRIGRTWKRGYLLYGPPGTGKSSLIAAIANYLKFDLYDLQLGSIDKDSTLRRLMMSITNKSILVIEDIDCASGLSSRGVARPRSHEGLWDGSSSNDDDDVDDGSPNAPATPNDKKELSLSGLLNFIDGLWSSCGDERIIILTTNYKERLDPALLRPGRMDMHIHMSYLRMPGFRTLAYNYLGLSEHPLFGEIEELLEKTDASPAEAAEELIRSEDPNICLNGVVNMLKQKKIKKKEIKGNVDGVGSEPFAEKQHIDGESTSHIELS